jgi:hypothetical protein
LDSVDAREEDADKEVVPRELRPAEELLSVCEIGEGVLVLDPKDGVLETVVLAGGAGLRVTEFDSMPCGPDVDVVKHGVEVLALVNVQSIHRV